MQYATLMEGVGVCYMTLIHDASHQLLIAYVAALE